MLKFRKAMIERSSPFSIKDLNNMTADQIIANESFERLLRYAFNMFRLRYDDYDDFRQEVYLYMRKYPKPKNLGLTTYIVNVAKWTSSELRKRNKKHNKMTSDIEVAEWHTPYTDSSYDLIDQNDHEESILSLLTGTQKKILKMKLDGMKNSDIVREVGCSRQNVSCVVATASRTIIDKMNQAKND